MEEAPLANPPADAEAKETEYPASEEEETEDHEEAAPAAVVTTPAPNKRGSPAGSKNQAPDVYTALLERMTQLEQTLTRPPPPPESTTGGTPETPAPKAKRQPQRQPQNRPVAVVPPVDLLMDQMRQAREQNRQRQMDFYATFLPS